MSREERLERRVKYLLWVLMVLNMIGMMLLQHPEVVRAEVGPSTNFAAAPAAASPLVGRAA